MKIKMTLSTIITPITIGVVLGVVTLAQATTNNPLAGVEFYVKPNSSATQQINQWDDSRSTDKTRLKKIAQEPTAQWFGDWNSNIKNDVATLIAEAQAAQQVPILVLYNIPQRDCGAYSSGGTADAASYKQFVRQFAKGLGTAQAVVIIEPDALGVISCLTAEGKQSRYKLLTYAVKKLKKHNNVSVYIDAGHPNWVPADVMAKRLKKSGLGKADGFALNVSNFYNNRSNLRYGRAISKLTHHAHFVIDTSRNGNGISQPYDWCNPSGMKLGTRPTTETNHKLLDAVMWIKPPGESDGNCNGGPTAGAWWLDYALELAR